MKPYCDQPIVIIDDSDEDYDVMAELMNEFGVAQPLLRLADGKAARSFIAREAEYASVPRPAFIVLDLSLPFVSGRDLLVEIRASPWLKTVPVLINSTSSNPRDIELCYQRGANSFFVKPADFLQFERTLKAICEYWLELAATSTGETPVAASAHRT